MSGEVSFYTRLQNDDIAECSLCLMYFDSDKLLKHEAKEHNIQCRVQHCPLTFCKQTAEISHVYDQHPQMKVKYQTCPHCLQIMSSTSHTKTKHDKPCQELSCKLLFSNNEQKLNHYVKEHVKPRYGMTVPSSHQVNNVQQPQPMLVPQKQPLPQQLVQQQPQTLPVASSHNPQPPQIVGLQQQQQPLSSPQLPPNIANLPQPLHTQQLSTSRPQPVTQPQQQQQQQVMNLQPPPQQIVNSQPQLASPPSFVSQPHQQVVQQHQVKQVGQQQSSTINVSAQLVQTEQGPRIILQGLQGVNLSQDQLSHIQQQVKTQLLKQQALARQQGKVPPTKVSLELVLGTGLLLTDSLSSPPSTQASTTSISLASPATPSLVTSSSSSLLGDTPLSTPSSSIPSITLSGGPSPAPAAASLAPAAPGSPSKVQTVTGLPQHIVKQGKYIVKDGKKVLVLPQNVMQQYAQSLKQQTSHTKAPLISPTGPLGSPTGGLTSPSGIKLLSPGSGPKSDEDKFELTDDYIQQTIKEALESGNLTPDLQEKLMNQLNDETIKVKGKSSTGGRKSKKKEVYDPMSGERMDDEWQPNSWAVKNKINNQIKQQQVIKDSSSNLISSSSNIEPPQHIIRPLNEKKLSLYTPNRLNSMLFKHKEQLKKDIAKKRQNLEKNLMQEIQTDIESLKKQAALKLGSEKSTKLIAAASPPMAKPPAVTAENRKRKLDTTTSSPKTPQQPAKKRQKSGSEKKERLYCICKTKYDETKFYVGCDICQNWFHGACVGITQKMSKKMAEYICDECLAAKQGTAKYCLCKQPYDEAGFYIGCERCPDWFHGHCVGILALEADGINDYECPECNGDYPMNKANLKKLNPKSNDLDPIKKLFKSILGSKHSAPFRKPMDKRSNKKYYDLVKEPMDLETMGKRLDQDQYRTLATFLGDLTRITEGARYYYPPDSVNSKHAEQLEFFIVSRVPAIRQKLLAK